MAQTIFDSFIGQHTSPSTLMKRILQTAYTLDLPIALWRMPKEEDQHLIIDLSGTPTTIDGELEKLDAGFILAPFYAEGEEQLYLHADLHFNINQKALTEGNRSFVIGSEEHRMKEVFLQKLEENLKSEDKNEDVPYHVGSESIHSLSKEQHLALVEKGISKIKEGEFNKVVLSRSKQTALPASFNVIQMFEKLCSSYKNAFVSFTSIPEIGTWIGATPETLLSVDAQQIFRTMSLAGTQARNGLNDMSRAMWSQKEIEEQAMVSRYIINCFKKIRVREYEERGPKTVPAGNLLHLCSYFAVDTDEINFPELGSVMLKLLHPTSAICGMPLKPSREFILKEEGYDRSFYAGFLGPINMEQHTHIFVNLRCAQLLAKKAILYAGGGITADSIPEKEFQETEIKMDTMLKIIES
ncbi:chorismate-binding protein [Sediminitomix flava]|uniref:isochorismate synthase n=1 Tax=Sediminitomix flava TaxID=379075 RepID=A0A315Z7D9_SEDFL|nr:chorismate-binding protein [Sediminitomix flava]PWJ40872.1 isochorismate synthase [Sediminitomix flava]